MRNALRITLYCSICIVFSHAARAQHCLVDFSFEAQPPPVDGHYVAGQSVLFCFTVEEWDPQNVNWLHGAVPILGAGWDTTSLAPGLPPDECGGVGGTWTFAESVTGTSSIAIGPQGPGWFFDLDNDGDAGNNLGDVCTGPWHFCFFARVKDSIDCVDGSDLSVSVNTFSDSETGAWGIAGCGADTVPVLPATALCALAMGTAGTSSSSLLAFPSIIADAITVRNAGPAGELFLFDATGRLVRAVPVSARSERTMSRGGLPSGIYRLIFQDARTGQRRYAGSVAAE